MDTYHLRPIGSMYSRPLQETGGYIELITSLPKTIKDVISSPSIGSYIEGVGKSHKIPAEMQPAIAFVILKIAIGKLPIADFTMTLSQELSISIDEAQKMATEIYKDLIAPIQDDLDAFLANQNAPRKPSVDSSMAARSTPITAPPRKGVARTPNVLDLKELTGRKEQKDLPQPSSPRIAPTASRTVNLKNPSAPAPVPPPPTPPAPPQRTFPLPPMPR